MFKRILSSVLSAACLLSGTAFAGSALLQQTDIEVNAATTATPATFSWDNATVYFLLTDRFKNGDTSNDNAYGRQDINVGDQRATFHGGDFKGITQKINDGYFDDLGVNAIWLTAPYEQIHGYIVGGDTFYHYSYHGYYVLDYTEPDKAYGTKAEFQTLVDTAHEHGIRIVMDIVMNHAGYNSMYDMNEYNYGTLKSGWENFYYSPNTSSTSGYHNNIDYDTSASDWGRWWGNDWVRSGLPGYAGSNGGSAETQSLAGLPDFKTEQTKQVSVPQFLQDKWEKEGTLSTKNAKYGTSDTVTGFISSWLADWVRTYGIDGFRCDTAKHVEKASWNVLKTKCVAALKEWKAANPTKKLDDLDFWMTGEHWDHGCYKDDYYTSGGFDSMINFETTGGGMVSQSMVANTYKNYAASINSDPSFNVLSYVSSHDSTLARPSDMYALGSAFLMLPGAVQIYYGDETARDWVSGIPQDGNGGAGHSLRSDMPWSSLNTALVTHWGIVGRFRNSHVAVGGGQNYQLTATNGIAFGRSYNKNGVTDKVAGVIYASNNTDVTVTVSDLWADGTQLHNFYDDTYAIVSGGKVTFNSGAHGTILIEEPSVKRGIVKVSHVDKTTGTVLKTEMMSGAIGDSYTTSSSSFEGYKLSSNSGNTTGVYGDDQIDVTYYYTFDSANYGYVVTKHVDVSTNAEITDSVTTVGRIGTAYTTTAASVKHYEVDTVPSNATGTISSGTTTVTYKYVYVEPTNLIVHYYNSNNWSAVALYAYDDSGTTVQKFTGAWPGTAMNNDGNGWWSYEVEDVESATVIFNNNGGGSQEPGVNKPGYSASGEVWIKGGTVNPTGKVNVKHVTASGTVLSTETITGMADGSTTYTTSAKTFSGYSLVSSPSNASGIFTEDTITVVYTYDQVDPSTYGTIITKYVDAATGAEIAAASTISQKIGTTYTTTAATVNGYELASTPANATGTVQAGTTTVTYTYNEVQSSNLKVHYYNSNNWSTVYLYAYDNSGTTVQKYTGAWPGKAMTNDGSGWWSAEVPGVTEATVIFTNNAGAQEPSGVGTPGYSASGEVWFQNGSTTSSGKVIVKHVSTNGTTLATQTLTGLEGTTYTTSAKTFDGYTLKTTPSNATGQFTAATITVTYTYEPDAAEDTLVNTSTINSEYLSVGQSVVYSGSAEGGTAPYKYAFYYKRASGKVWKAVGTEFGSTTAISFATTAADDYDIKITVMDAAGATADKTFSVTVSDGKSSAFENTSTISTTGGKVGTKVRVYASASGSSGYTYAFYYKRTTARLWHRQKTGEFSTTSAYQFTPTDTGVIDVRVDVKDKNNNIVSRHFTVTISSDYVDTSTVVNVSTNTSYAAAGTRIYVTANASGGKAPYTYAFYYKRLEGKSWNLIGTGFSSTNTASIKFSSPGEVVFMAQVRDANGGMTSQNTHVEIY